MLQDASNPVSVTVRFAGSQFPWKLGSGQFDRRLTLRTSGNENSKAGAGGAPARGAWIPVLGRSKVPVPGRKEILRPFQVRSACSWIARASVMPTPTSARSQRTSDASTFQSEKL